MKQINIGMLGCGTVGIGTAKILLEKKALVTARTGMALNVKNIADIDTERDRGLDLAPGVMTADAAAVVDDPEIDIIVELIGGTTVAKDLVLRAIDNGKSIVTANKALLSAFGNEIFPRAADAGVDVAYEASVGGCMPIIKSIRESLIGNDIHAMQGILNGTCNYILSKITAEKCSFETALKEAQEKGFAEADPTLDVDGFDTAHKLAILNAIAYGMAINLDDIYVEGIRRITPVDIEFADDFGYTVKLLAISKQIDGAVEARVHPTMVPEDDILSSVSGSLNAVTVAGDCVENMLLYGHGAGMMPTASAVAGDIVDLARNIAFGASGRVPSLSYQAEKIQPLPVLPMEKLSTRYYFRFNATDQPGVLSKIAGVLGGHNISIKSVNQKGREKNGPIPLVMLTHKACEADVNKALAEITSFDVVADVPMVIRIEDER
ncbi:MAG: homoserine dehydrogenase [Thermodesulfobacteriota bacterium]|nr:homoserine dehydrogenase [Thermodesulfobacteriota bacterium]